MFATWAITAMFVVRAELPEQSLTLDWHAAEACPSELQVREQIHAMLLVAPSGPPLTASALLIANGSEGYELVLALSQGELHEEHRLRGADCDALSGLAAMLITTALDPFGFVAPPVIPAHQRPQLQRPTPAPVVVPTPSPEPDPVEPPQVDIDAGFGELREVDEQPRAKQRRPLGGLVSVSGVGFVNVLPGVGGGVRLGLGVELGALRVEAAGSAWLGSGFRGDVDTTVGGQLGAWSLELGGCGVPSWRRLEFPLCARAGAGQMIGEGVGVGDPLRSAQPWVWLGADASLEWWIVPRFGLWFGVGAGGSVARPSFEVVGSDARFETPAVFGRIQAGLAGRFGPRARAPQTKPRSTRGLADSKGRR